MGRLPAEPFDTSLRIAYVCDSSRLCNCQEAFMSDTTHLAEAETSAIPVKQERRGSIRYPCGQEVTFRLFGMPDDHCWNAELLDVSASGAGLVTGCAFGRGTVLEVRPADRSLTVSRLL